MARMALNPLSDLSDKADEAAPAPLVFDTYLQASKEAARRGTRNAANGLISRVEKSPYGGYVVRTWPIEMLVDLDLRPAIRSFEKATYEEL